jgi:hypothetical protein
MDAPPGPTPAALLVYAHLNDVDTGPLLDECSPEVLREMCDHLAGALAGMIREHALTVPGAQVADQIRAAAGAVN